MATVQAKTPQVGEQAPDFTLTDTDMQPVSLHDFHGKTVILAFFPAAFSSGCTKEMCTFRDSLTQLNQANAQVLGISVDLPYSLKRFKETESINFPLLSDFDHRAIQAYGVVDNNFRGFTSGLAKRSVFVIDPSGTISWEWAANSPGEQPDYSQVLDAAEQIASK
jgi:peroxiredoxin